MLDIIYQVIWISCMTVLFINAEPMILIKRWMGFKEEEMGKNPLRDFFTKMLYCSKCSGFWLGLIFTLNFPQAVIISIVSELIDRRLKSSRI